MIQGWSFPKVWTKLGRKWKHFFFPWMLVCLERNHSGPESCWSGALRVRLRCTANSSVSTLLPEFSAIHFLFVPKLKRWVTKLLQFSQAVLGPAKAVVSLCLGAPLKCLKRAEAVMHGPFNGHCQDEGLWAHYGSSVLLKLAVAVSIWSFCLCWQKKQAWKYFFSMYIWSVHSVVSKGWGGLTETRLLRAHTCPKFGTGDPSAEISVIQAHLRFIICLLLIQESNFLQVFISIYLPGWRWHVGWQSTRCEFLIGLIQSKLP